MHAQCAAATFCEHLEISTSLRRFDNSERIFLARYRQVLGIITGDLQKDPRIRPAFVSLPRGVQEARTEAEASRDMFLVAERVPNRLQCFLVGLVHLDVAEDCEVITCLDAAEVLLQIAGQRFVGAGSLGEVGGIFLVGEKLHAFVVENWFLGRQGAGLLVLGSETLRGNLAGFDVGLVEGVDT